MHPQHAATQALRLRGGGGFPPLDFAGVNAGGVMNGASGLQVGSRVG